MVDTFNLLSSKYGNEIAQNTLDSYKEIESNFIAKKWKPSELDGGHFVESVRRIIEFELTNRVIPFNTSLPNFNNDELTRYERCAGDESYRLLIPRILKSIYNIRNKRGVGHVSSVSPNKMDSTYILYSSKWVLSEIIRLNSGLSISETQLIIDELVDRNIDFVWKDQQNIYRILNNKIKASDQVLMILYDKNTSTINELQTIIEYKNNNNFKKILSRLHSKRLIEMSEEKKQCTISPTGKNIAEEIIIKYRIKESN